HVAPLSLHDALPISIGPPSRWDPPPPALPDTSAGRRAWPDTRANCSVSRRPGQSGVRCPRPEHPGRPCAAAQRRRCSTPWDRSWSTPRRSVPLRCTGGPRSPGLPSTTPAPEPADSAQFAAGSRVLGWAQNSFVVVEEEQGRTEIVPGCDDLAPVVEFGALA